MKREILDPHWSNNKKNQILCKFRFEDGSVMNASIMDTADGNPDWKEIMTKYGVKGVDRITKKIIQNRRKKDSVARQRKKEKDERRKNEELFNLKLKAFEMEEVRQSRETKLKSKIRRSQSEFEVQAWTSVLLLKEYDKSIMESENETKPKIITEEVVVTEEKPAPKKRGRPKKATTKKTNKVTLVDTVNNDKR